MHGQRKGGGEPPHLAEEPLHISATDQANHIEMIPQSIVQPSGVLVPEMVVPAPSPNDTREARSHAQAIGL